MVGPPVFPSRSREAFVLISKICPPFIVASSLSLLDPPPGLQRYRCCPIPAAQGVEDNNVFQKVFTIYWVPAIRQLLIAIGFQCSNFWFVHSTLINRKYVRKWRLFKRNRIICLEVAVNGQFLPGKLIFLIAWKSQNFLEICLEKSNFFVKSPEKIELFGEICMKIEFFFNPDPRLPRRQTRLMPLLVINKSTELIN